MERTGIHTARRTADKTIEIIFLNFIISFPSVKIVWGDYFEKVYFFIIGNYFESKDDKNHFYIFVYYSNFENVKENPELYVVPATEISAIVKERESVNNVSIVSLREKYSKDFSDAVKIFK